jgi:chromate reductase, NAD(P)H dehydrogenase (quinone)
MEPPRILAFAGSLRKDSYNRKLLKYAIQGAQAAGGRVVELGPERLVLPLYNGDLEGDGVFPDDVAAWRAEVARCDGLLIASPEYNHGISGVLKNAIDWASRPPSAFKGKVAASFGTTPGAFGTARSQMSLRTSLMSINVWIVPRTVLIPHAAQQFDEAGNLTNQRYGQELAALGVTLVKAIEAGIGRL